MFLVEEQLRKNEQLHNMTEDMIELKGNLFNFFLYKSGSDRIL